MIAGKRYDGLVADIWSSGIVLYAMLCGYLPFEDPNTKKLYKKIIKGSFILPDYLSEFAKDILKKILNTNPEKRYKIQDIRQHPWYNLSIPVIVNEGFFIGKTIIPIDSNILSSLSDYGIKPALAQKQIEDNRHNDITTTYYLLIARHKKESGYNLNELNKCSSKTDPDILGKRLNLSSYKVKHSVVTDDKGKSPNKSWLEQYNLNTENRRNAKRNISNYKATPQAMTDTNCFPNGINIKSISAEGVINKVTQRVATHSANRDLHKKNLTEILNQTPNNLSLIPELSTKYKRWPLEIFADQPHKSEYQDSIPQARTHQTGLIKSSERNKRPPINQRAESNDFVAKRTNRFTYSRRFNPGAIPNIKMQDNASVNRVQKNYTDRKSVV